MTEPTPTFSLWIIEDSPDYRQQLADLLELEETIHCAAIFGSYDEARDQLYYLKAPDVILLDLNLPGTHGLQAISELRSICPIARVVVLTVNGQRKSVFDALRAGAAGYLLKSEPFDGIVQNIRDVVVGGRPLSSAVTPFVLDSLKGAPAAEPERQLAEREIEILELLAEGASRSEIADKLSIATSTVDYHLRGVYRKFGVYSASGAVGKAFRLGLLK